uniref:Putative secreted protein n=1 Tax=Ixodes ricinus TaxID=34613 RepID=A0A6B0UIA4_IXORI
MCLYSAYCLSLTGCTDLLIFVLRANTRKNTAHPKTAFPIQTFYGEIIRGKGGGGRHWICEPEPELFAIQTSRRCNDISLRIYLIARAYKTLRQSYTCNYPLICTRLLL